MLGACSRHGTSFWQPVSAHQLCCVLGKRANVWFCNKHLLGAVEVQRPLQVSGGLGCVWGPIDKATHTYEWQILHSTKVQESYEFWKVLSINKCKTKCQEIKFRNMREEMVDRASEKPGTGSVCTNTHTLSLMCPGEVAQTGSTNRKSVYDPPVLAGI